MTDGLTFDSASHTYRLDGRAVPSVTQALSTLQDWSAVPADALAAASERGTDVHLLCQYRDLGILDPASVDPRYEGYLVAWDRFIAEQKPKWFAIEQPMASRRHGFAGTPDRLGLVGKRAAVDIKTVAARLHPVVGLQLAAYRALAAEHENDPLWLSAQRLTVQLRPDGRYEITRWADPGDWLAFLGLLQLRSWAARNNALPTPQPEGA